MAVRIEHRVVRVALREGLGRGLAVHVVLGTTVDGEMRRFMDKGSSPGVGAGIRGRPERPAEMDGPESIRVDESEGVRLGAGAVEGVRVEVV